jgi:hypothetical protein
MRIAIIGWGSLIWCPGALNISTRWRSDGPVLPIEFARISADGRLTLVINPGSREVTTYWALSAFDTLKQTIENLRQREGTALDQIHAVVASNSVHEAGSNSASVIRSWLEKAEFVDAAVWTGLASNWQAQRRMPFNTDDAVRYLSELEHEENSLCYKRACEYIQNAPTQIQTDLRAILSSSSDFKDAILPAVLFE